jgi:hypothetical protein
MNKLFINKALTPTHIHGKRTGHGNLPIVIQLRPVNLCLVQIALISQQHNRNWLFVRKKNFAVYLFLPLAIHMQNHLKIYIIHMLRKT